MSYASESFDYKEGKQRTDNYKLNQLKKGNSNQSEVYIARVIWLTLKIEKKN